MHIIHTMICIDKLLNFFPSPYANYYYVRGGWINQIVVIGMAMAQTNI